METDCMLHQGLYIANLGIKGRGVFCRDSLSTGSIIEWAPVIVMPAADRKLLDKTLLHDYIFEWGENKDQCAMALGYIPIYNHSYNSNCEYFMNYDTETIYIKTMKPVAANEELTINYNGIFNDETEIWFEAA